MSAPASAPADHAAPAADPVVTSHRPLRVAVAGATGAVGAEFLRLLEDRRWPLAHLRLLASARSAGTSLRFRGEDVRVEELTDASLQGHDVALVSSGSERSIRFADAAVRGGAVVIDNSSAFRMDPGVPLVVPEINPEAVAGHKGVLAVPNCTTIVFLMAVAPLHREARLRRAVVSSYQAASGAGASALAEYDEQVRAAAAGRPLDRRVLPRVLHGNVIPQVDTFLPDGSTKEERKLDRETRKILGDDDVRIAATCVRVPVRRAHSVSAALEFERPLSPERAREILSRAPGVSVLDGASPADYPTPLDASGRLEVLVGRIREDPSREGGLLLWSAGDQLLKGAAWNAVQMAELLMARALL
jgi:aspartate-semialdehyde dehydrogenase